LACAPVRGSVKTPMSWPARMRSRKTVTPEASAARARRKVAVRSSARGAPKISISAAPKLLQRAASTPARSTASASLPRTSDKTAGSTPNSASPTPFSRPASPSRKSCRAQNRGLPDAARRAMARLKPAAADQSALQGAWISCRQARLSPPPRKASTPGAPKAKRATRSAAGPLSPALARRRRKTARVFARDGEAPLCTSIQCMAFSHKCSCYVLPNKHPKPNRVKTGPRLLPVNF
jgi:hypothetical protein